MDKIKNFTEKTKRCVYDANYFSNSKTKNLLELYTLSKLPKVLEEYGLSEKNEIFRLEIGQVINVYYQNDYSTFLLIINITRQSNEILDRMILIDEDVVEILKRRIWRNTKNKSIISLILEKKTNKKISQVNILDVIMDGDKNVYYFLNHDKNDFRRENLKKANYEKSRDSIIDESIVDHYKQHAPTREIHFIDKKEFEEILKTHKILHKNYNTLGLNENIFIEWDSETILIAIATKFEDHPRYRVLVDKSNFTILKDINWSVKEVASSDRHPSHMRFVLCRILNKELPLHQFLMKEEHLPENDKFDLLVDHINRNRLDNRRSNLRLVSVVENNRNQCTRVNNSSGVTGVRFNPQKNAWFAKRDIYPDGRFGKPKARALRTNSFEEAVIIRKYLEKIPDSAFLSDSSTVELIRKYCNPDFVPKETKSHIYKRNE